MGPREKLLLKGAQSLSDQELLMVLIGSGVQGHPVDEAAKGMLELAGGTVGGLSRIPAEGLTSIPGVGLAKAVMISAAMEIGKRRESLLAANRKAVVIRTSRDVFDRFRQRLMDLSHEEFWLLLLRRSNEVMAELLISRGGLSGTVADPKIIFAKALAMRAAGIVAVHNHPSGSTRPSRADRELTKNLQWAGKMLDCPLMDHIIVAGANYFSFADEGEL